MSDVLVRSAATELIDDVAKSLVDILGFGLFLNQPNKEDKGDHIVVVLLSLVDTDLCFVCLVEGFDVCWDLIDRNQL